MDNWTAPVSLIAALLVALPASLHSWGANGHRIVAQVANRHLDSDSKMAVERILGPGTLALSRSATWPDEIRSNPAWNDIQRWHFLTVEDGANHQDHVRRTSAIDSVRNVAEAIMFFSDLLGGNVENRAQFEAFIAARDVEPYLGSVDAAALSLLVHFVGDVHQPLHVGRGADAGGNGIEVNWFEAPTNLHTVWDEGLIEQQDLSFTELARMIDVATEVEEAEWRDEPLGTWIQEAVDLRDQVYAISSDDVPRDVPSARRLPRRFQNPLPYLGYQYVYLNTETVNHQLAKGGLRLAGRLNAILH